MTIDEFQNKLKNNNLNLKTFCEIAKTGYSGANKWKYSSVPDWVESWFELYEKNKALQDFELAAQKLCATLKTKDSPDHKEIDQDIQ